MANDVAIIEKTLDLAMPTLANILAATPGLPARSFKAALLSQVQKKDRAAQKIMECTVSSLMNCACTFAGLGVMPDGVSGQAFILPFKGIATPVIGYMGYNTLGDRAGRTITGDIWFEGDDLKYAQGSTAFVEHIKKGPPGDRRIVGAWSCAAAKDRTPIVEILFLEELEETRLKAPSVKAGVTSPWDDVKNGRRRMYIKTGKRRLRASMPLLHGRQGDFIRADAMETQFEVTERPHYYLPGQDGALHVTDGTTGAPVDVKPPPAAMPDPTAPPPRLKAKIDAGEAPKEFESPTEWKMALLKLVSLNSRRKQALLDIRAANAEYMKTANDAGGEAAAAALVVAQAFNQALATLEKKS